MPMFVELSGISDIYTFCHWKITIGIKYKHKLLAETCEYWASLGWVAQADEESVE